MVKHHETSARWHQHCEHAAISVLALLTLQPHRASSMAVYPENFSAIVFSLPHVHDGTDRPII